MYLQCVLISRDKTVVDQQIQKLMIKQNIDNIRDAKNTKQYRLSIRTNHKFIDPQLTKDSIHNNQKLRIQVAKHKIQLAFVSPLKADIQTCLNLFGYQQTSVIVQPSLVPRINSVSSIGENNTSILQKSKQKLSIMKLQDDPHWYLTFGKSQGGQKQQSLNVCISAIQKSQNYETLSNYYQRLIQFKKDLINHIGKTRSKIAIIAHRDVLEFLTSTGYHEDYELINNVSFNFGQVKSEFLWIQGVQAELQDKNIPFCS